MTIAVLNVGTPATLNYTTVQTLTWTPSPAPSQGSDLIIPFAFMNVGALTANTPSCVDNQTGNTYRLIVQQTNLSGDGTQGALNSAIFRAKNINVSGTFTISITTVAGRQSSTANHVEVSGLDQTTNNDQSGGFTSGSSTVGSETVTAGGVNVLANELVICVTSVYNKTNANQTLPSPPTTNYASIMIGTAPANAGATLAQCFGAGYKTVSSIETSAATWAMTGINPVACAAIATFKAAALAANSAVVWLA